MADKGTDLAMDLLWFFDGQAWAPPMFVGAQEAFEALALKLPCALSFVTDQKNRDSEQVNAWQAEVRTLMKELGFYVGHFKNRDDRHFEKRLKEATLRFAEPKGAVARVHVAVSDCKETNDPARCAYSSEARRRASKHGGVFVGMKNTEGVPELWRKLRRAVTNRVVVSLQFFDHGAPNQQVVGGDHLTAQSDIPTDIGSRMASGAEITLYGCSTMAGKRDQELQLSALATHLGASLLFKGGRVIGFKAPVGLDTVKMRVIEPDAKNRVVFEIPRCDGSAVVGEIIRLMRSMKGKVKVKYAEYRQRGGAEVESPDLLDYPGNYPNAGYYA